MNFPYDRKNNYMNTEKIKNEIKEKTTDVNPERREGPIAKAIETETSRLPSDFFLWAAGGAMIASLTLKLLKKNSVALFVGQWAAPLLLFGVYNKIVKLEGHDQQDARPD